MAVMRYIHIFSLNLYICKTEWYVNNTDFKFKNSLEYKNSTNQDFKSVYKHVMHNSKVNVHSKITLGNKTDNQTPLIMQGKVQNITNK